MLVTSISPADLAGTLGPGSNPRKIQITALDGIYPPNCREDSLQEFDFEVDPTSQDLRHELVPLADVIESETFDTRSRENERRHTRMTIPRAKACVRLPEKGEEFVDLVDLSKGGASFRSQRVYPLGTWIRIAAPCTVGSANIFVLARVVRARRAHVGREYGVEYVNLGSL